MERDYIEASCALLFRCEGADYALRAGFESEADCVASLEAASVGSGGCAGEASAVDACLNAMEAESCAEWESGGPPSSCAGLCG